MEARRRRFAREAGRVEGSDARDPDFAGKQVFPVRGRADADGGDDSEAGDDDSSCHVVVCCEFRRPSPTVSGARSGPSPWLIPGVNHTIADQPQQTNSNGSVTRSELHFRIDPIRLEQLRKLLGEHEMCSGIPGRPGSGRCG